MGIDLPKDATGREIPLDTKTLYNEDGKIFDVDHFTYSARQTIPSLKWGVVFMNCRYDYCSSFYLEPPDSWEALKEDLKRSFRSFSNVSCAYFKPARNDCGKCRADQDGDCTVQMFEHIESRIHKLRVTANE